METSRLKKIIITGVIIAAILLAINYFTKEKKYIVTFGESNIGTVEVDKNKSVVKPVDPVREGYKFIGWYEEETGEEYNFNSKVTSDLFLIAKWEKVNNQESDKTTYTVTFYDNNGTAIYSSKVEKGKTVLQLADPTKNGYEFLGWYNGNTLFDFNTKINSNIELTAKYVAKDSNKKIYIVSFDSNGGTSIASQKIEENKTAYKPVTPVREDYSFVSWQLNGKNYDFSTKVTNNITLKAKWQRTTTSKYTVTFDTSGGTAIQSRTVLHGDIVLKPADPIKEGYTFVTWQSNGKDYDFTAKVTDNIILKAVWKKIEAKTYTVKFDSKGGTSISDQIVTENSGVKKPANPTKKGYTFLYWKLDGNKYNFATKVTRNMTLVAEWEKRDECTVTFNSNGGSTVPKVVLYCGDVLNTLPTPTYGNKKFLGWYSDGMKLEVGQRINSNIEFVASWD